MPGGYDNGNSGTLLPFEMRGLSPDECDSGPMSIDNAGCPSEPWAMRPKVPFAVQDPFSSATGGLDNLEPEEEEETCTELLAGETFVPCSLVEYEGRRAAIFVFSVRAFASWC